MGPSRSGGAIVVEQLAELGIGAVFCVPGESYLPVLDALRDARDEIRTVVARHEGAAATMAEAYGRLTGRPGVCLVTRGPGATHAMVGLHTAWQGSTPMLLLVGQVPRRHLGRDAFQELDCRGMQGTLAKRVERVMAVDRLPETLARAASTATSGRPGPVVVELPEDVLAGATTAAVVEPAPAPEPAPSEAQLARVETLLQVAERPLVIVGGGGWTTAARADLSAWLDAVGVPVAAGFRRADIVDHDHPCYVGHLGIPTDPELAQQVRDADVVLAIGTRLGEITTSGWDLIEAPVPRQRVIHVHPDGETLGSVVRPWLPINATPAAMTAALRRHVTADPSRWAEWRQSAKQQLRAFVTPGPAHGALDLAHVVAHLDDALDDDAVVTSGAGNYAIWVHRFLRATGQRRHLGPQSGAMGYGLPAAIAAAIAQPDRQVVAVAGDGCVQMTGAELATAVQEQVALVLLVVDNRRYGTIRMHQERRYPGRVHATDLVGPDFVEWARSYGAHAEAAERTEEFAGALARALAFPGPAVVHLLVDPDQLTPDRTVADEASQHAGGAS